MLETYEIYYIVGFIVAILISFFTPAIRTKLVELNRYLVQKLGKDTVEALKVLGLYLVKQVVANKSVIIGRINENSKVKIDEKGLKQIDKGYKKGKDTFK